MDIKTIKALLRIAKAKLKVARTEFLRIKNSDPLSEHDDEWEWENALEEAGDESFACDEIVRFLVANLEKIKNKSNN
jgi:hypothetical protein